MALIPETTLKTLLIKVVKNGFIVNEDYQVDPRISDRSYSEKVFNTKKQLYEYFENAITESFEIPNEYKEKNIDL